MRAIFLSLSKKGGRCRSSGSRGCAVGNRGASSGCAKNKVLPSWEKYQLRTNRAGKGCWQRRLVAAAMASFAYSLPPYSPSSLPHQPPSPIVVFFKEAAAVGSVDNFSDWLCLRLDFSSYVAFSSCPFPLAPSLCCCGKRHACGNIVILKMSKVWKTLWLWHPLSSPSPHSTNPRPSHSSLVRLRFDQIKFL